MRTNVSADRAWSPPVVTVMGWKVAPVGTVTVNEPADAAVTTALAPPTKTVFAVVEGLKPVPVITTLEPAGPEAGEK